jgi:hypothetical protein
MIQFSSNSNDSNNPQRRYTQEQVEAILQRALQRQQTNNSGNISHDDLIETARELGIDPSQLEMAVMEQTEVGAVEDAKKTWIAQQKRSFKEHLRSYLIINGILLLINIMTGDPFWAMWPILGWGIGIAFDAANTFWPSDKEIEKGARKVVQRQMRERQQQQRELQRQQKFTIETKGNKLVIQKGNKRLEIG